MKVDVERPKTAQKENESNKLQKEADLQKSNVTEKPKTAQKTTVIPESDKKKETKTPAKPEDKSDGFEGVLNGKTNAKSNQQKNEDEFE